jgi:hypothetical protein
MNENPSSGTTATGSTSSRLLGRWFWVSAFVSHCFVLMDNHYHLLLELTDTNLSRAVQWLNVSFSVWFNRRHQRSGHLFQGRFESLAVSRDEWALELSCYVHLNPARIQALGLSRRDRQGQRVGLSPAPNVEGFADALPSCVSTGGVRIARRSGWDGRPSGCNASQCWDGRRSQRLKVRELVAAAELRNYGVVATNAKRYELRLERDRAEKSRMKQVLKLLNCESDPNDPHAIAGWGEPKPLVESALTFDTPSVVCWG